MKLVSIDFYTRISNSASVYNVAGGIAIGFYDTLQYWLPRCSNTYTEFPTDYSTKTDKTWRISLVKTTGIRLMIHCNEAQVLNILVSDDTCDVTSWNNYWSGTVQGIKFPTSDTASNYYYRGTLSGNINQHY